MTLRPIHINEIPEEGHIVDAALEPSWLREVFLDSEFSAEDDARGRLKVRLDRHGRDVTVSGTVEATLSAKCVRCLEPVKTPIRSEFTLHLQPGPASMAAPQHKHSEVELSTDELDVDYYEADQIDLGRWAREQLLLEAPAHPNCLSDCKDPIAVPQQENPVREAERKIDPRLAPLMKFAKKE